jgi:hypothetical protein
MLFTVQKDDEEVSCSRAEDQAVLWSRRRLPDQG